MSLNEAYGQHVSTETTDPYKNQKVFESLTEEARKEQYELCKQWLLQEVSDE